jgi:hypothetical protein
MSIQNETNEQQKEYKFGAKCPKCDTPWTKTPRIICDESWWHCVKCEKKAEDIPKEKGVNPIEHIGWDKNYPF